MSADNGGPAFPHEYKYGDGTAARADGMSLRDYLAAHAPDEPDWFGLYLAGNSTYVDSITQLAMWRFYYADQMLKARKS